MNLWPAPRAINILSKKRVDKGESHQNLIEIIYEKERNKWPTPASSDCRKWESGYWSLRNPKTVGGKIGQLNPDWVEWLMGWPIGWTSLEPMKELLWLDWSTDPADAKDHDKWPTPRCFMAYDVKRKKDSNFKNIEDVVYEKEKRKWPTPTESFGSRGGKANLESNHDTEKEFRKGLEKYGIGQGAIPRVATNIENRVSRLKAIGNGQVPQTALVAFDILIQKETSKYGHY